MRFWPGHIAAITPFGGIGHELWPTAVVTRQEFIIRNQKRPGIGGVDPRRLHLPHAFITAHLMRSTFGTFVISATPHALPAIVMAAMFVLGMHVALRDVLVQVMLGMVLMAMRHAFVVLVFAVVVPTAQMCAFVFSCHYQPLSTGIRGRVRNPSLRRLR